MKTKYLLMLAVLVLALGGLAACNRGGDDVGQVGDLLVGPVLSSRVESPNMDIDRPFYEFDLWWGYTWMTGQPWGEDAASAHWRDTFNIHMNQSNPDANAMDVLMLMVTAEDMPDAIWMDRNEHSVRVSELGWFLPIDDMKAMVHNTWYQDYVGPETAALLAFNGVNFAIPNWARTGTMGVDGGATGGNMAWMKTTNVWEAVGRPPLNTFEDLFNYAVAIRDQGVTNHLGQPVIPLLTESLDNFGAVFVNAIYRSFGGVVDGWWWTLLGDGTYGSVLRIPEWREAVFEANRWWREGLIPITNFTNTGPEHQALLNSGRGGLIWHDHSNDDQDSFRRLLQEVDPGNSVEIIRFDYGGRTHLYPPARGLSPDRIYHEHHNTLGWNAIFVTTSATRPDRIFEWASWMLTPMGAIEMMFGPRGEWWSQLDSDGFPILNPGIYPALLSAEEHARVGSWTWDILGPSNHVDDIKFAVNNRLPIELQSWVERMQYQYFTPRLRLTNEFVVIPMAISGTEPLGIARTQIIDRFEEILPQAIMAGSRAESEQILNDMLAFAEGLGLADIEARLNERYQYNLRTQISPAFPTGSIFRPPGTP